MISIRDFAAQQGVSYEAIRQQLKRYSSDLDGHIHKQGRTQYLDDVATSFLSERHRAKPVVMMDESESMQALQAENRQLLMSITELQNQIIGYQSKLLEAEQDKALLVAQTDRNDKLSADLKAEQDRSADLKIEIIRNQEGLKKEILERQQIEAELATVNADKQRAYDECESLRKTLAERESELDKVKSLGLLGRIFKKWK